MDALYLKPFQRFSALYCNTPTPCRNRPNCRNTVQYYCMMLQYSDALYPKLFLVFSAPYCNTPTPCRNRLNWRNTVQYYCMMLQYSDALYPKLFLVFSAHYCNTLMPYYNLQYADKYILRHHLSTPHFRGRVLRGAPTNMPPNRARSADYIYRAYNSTPQQVKQSLFQSVRAVVYCE